MNFVNATPRINVESNLSSSQRVFVTGGTGFLGHSLLPLLISKGLQVRVLVRHPDQHSWLRDLPLEIIAGDVEDAALLDQAITDCQQVIHAAGRFRFWGTPEQFERPNVHGTAHVLHAAIQAKVNRFVHISTLAVIGNPQPGRVIDENHPTAPADPYQVSKLQGESMVMQAFIESHLPVIILRPGAFYGPYGRYAFNRLFFEEPLIKKLRIKVDSGQHLNFPVYVGDVAAAAVAALTHGVPGEHYNICGDVLSHDALNDIISEIAGISSFRMNVPGWSLIALAYVWTQLSKLTRVEPYYPLNLRNYVFSDWPIRIDKAVCDLGFVPTPFAEGARHTIDWYRSSGLWNGY